MGWDSPLDVDTARVLLGTIAASLLTAIVFICTALLVAMQLASAALTPRIIALIFRDPITKLSLTLLVFAFTFSLSALVRIQAKVPLLTTHLAAYGCAPLLPRDRLSWIAVNFNLPAGISYSDFAPRMQAEGYFLLYGVPGNESHFQVSTIGDLSDDDVAGLLRAFDRVLGPVVATQATASLQPQRSLR